MYTKLLVVAGLVAVALAADVTVGSKGGRIIFDKNITASPAIWKQTNKLTVNATDNEVISQIVVIDNRPEKDGDAKVVEGGEGQKNVTIELASPAIFRGFDFSVKIFAAPDDLNSQIPQIPKVIGDDGQVQVPSDKDIVNDNAGQQHENENADDVILGQKPTASSKIDIPAIVGKDQQRPNRDTKDQKVNGEKTQQVEKQDDELEGLIKSVFSENPAQKNEDAEKKMAVPVTPIIVGNEGRIDLMTSDVESDAQSTEKNSAPALNTPKSESSTPKNAGTEGQQVLPLANKDGTQALKPTPESSNDHKNHHFNHKVPLPYVH